MEKNIIPWGLEQITDSLKVHEASKGRTMSSAAKRSGKWETKGGKTLACCIEQTWWRKN